MTDYDQGSLQSLDPDSKQKREFVAGNPEFNRFLAHSQDCIKILDLTGRLLFMNEGGMQVLEITDIKPFLNTSWIDFWNGDDREAASSALRKSREGSVARFIGYFETRIHREPRWWDVMVSPICDASGKPERLLALSRDVTQHKKNEIALQAALEQVNALQKKLQAENVYLQEEISKEHNFEEIVGNSKAILEVLDRVSTVAPTDSTVLILGETGCGKELIARAIHSHGARKHRPLVKVNCGAIPTGLVESELFGHMKGAFTGALERRVGRFELADGGSLFLDEISELPPETQVKLLRVLQEHEFEPLGSSRTIKVNVRIIGASNRDLEKAVQEGRFRADLFYRLNVLQITLPPLRERRSDIPLLASFFVDRFSRQFGKSITGISQDTMDVLSRYSWPGNIRELQNVIERAVVLCLGTVLRLGKDLLPVTGETAEHDATGASRAAESSPNTLENVERSHILQVLQETRGIIEGPRGAARILNLHPNTLRSRMKKLGIERFVTA